MTTPKGSEKDWREELRNLYGFDNNNVVNIADVEKLISSVEATATARERSRNVEIIEAYKEYVELLEKAEGRALGFMAAHGMSTGSTEEIKRGEELREKIKGLTTPQREKE